MNDESRDTQRRRRLLQAAGSALLAAPIAALLPTCRNTKAPAQVAATGDAASTAAPTTSAWARGGTAAIGDPARFPSPFTADLGSACALTCMTTIGPCHAASPERGDISDGWDGLPLRLALRVVDPDCQPVEGAIVEIWHTNHTGGYSGQIVAMCNNNQDDVGKQFFRGYQRTDTNGTVGFDTCYPGWYRGRAVHIHLRVMTGSYDANDRAASAVTTQLLFSDALNAEIFGGHADYHPHGQPDTTLETDNIVRGEADASRYLFDVQRMDDGVMFASKTLVIRKDLDAEICQAEGSGPMGRPSGGPPPEGMGPPPGAAPPDAT